MKKSNILAIVLIFATIISSLISCEDTHTHVVETWTMLGELQCDSPSLEQGVCTDCGETVYRYVQGEHNWELLSTTAPTCTSSGTEIYECTKCKTKSAKSLSELGHEYISGVCTRCSTEKPSWGGASGSGSGSSSGSGSGSSSGSGSGSTTTNPNATYESELAELNKNRDRLLGEIKDLKISIEFKKNLLSGMKSSLGIYPIYNMQYYKTKEAQLSSKLATLRSQWAYSSGTDRVYLEKQIKQVEEEYQDCLTAIKLVEKQEEIDEMEYLLDQMEYAAGPYYEQLVEELKQKYGK